MVLYYLVTIYVKYLNLAINKTYEEGDNRTINIDDIDSLEFISIFNWTIVVTC